ncbi:MAG: hypothetical protein CO095_00190, partial [Armatimonadetes bacterium CG_4_9_14_3_um_filter_58_7]
MPIREAGKIIRELRHNNLLAAGAGRTRTTGSTRPSKTSRSAGASYGPHTLSAARVIVGTKKAAGATKSLTKSISLERTLIQAPKGVAPVLRLKKSQLGLDFGGAVVEPIHRVAGHTAKNPGGKGSHYVKPHTTTTRRHEDEG